MVRAFSIGLTAGGSTAPPLRIGGDVRNPSPIAHVDPVHPSIARAADVQGIIIVEITIGLDGTVTDARVVRSIPLLEQTALDAVRQWRFEPPTYEGVPSRHRDRHP